MHAKTKNTEIHEERHKNPHSTKEPSSMSALPLQALEIAQSCQILILNITLLDIQCACEYENFLPGNRVLGPTVSIEGVLLTCLYSI